MSFFYRSVSFKSCKKFPPSGCVEVTVIPRKKISIKGKKNKNELTFNGFVVGQKNSFSQFMHGCKEVISMLLYPERTYSVIGLPIDEIFDYYITPEDIWKTDEQMVKI